MAGFGQDVDGGRGKSLATKAIGSTGLKHSGGFVHEEFLPQLAGQRGIRTYREMADNDAIVGAVLFAFTMLLRQVKWKVQAADETAEAEAAKEWLESVIEDMDTPMSAIVDEACSMFTYGHAPMEIIYKRRNGFSPDTKLNSRQDDGKLGIRAILLRAQQTITRWEIDDSDGEIMGLVQQPLNGPPVTIPMERMILFRTTRVRSNPEGRSLLRNAYRSWFFKKRIEEAEGIGVERDLAGLPMAKIPGTYFDASADDDEKATYAAWQQLVQNVRRDAQEGILIPSDRDASGHPLFEFSLLSTGGARTFDTTKIIDRYDRAIATSVLADFIFLGQNAVGSFALSSDKTALFSTALGAFRDIIADGLNVNMVPKLWRYNAFDPAIMPKLVPGDIEHPNIQELGAFIAAMSGAGAPLFPDRELENHLREASGLPPAPEEGEDMRTPAPGAQGDDTEDEEDGAGTKPDPKDKEKAA